MRPLAAVVLTVLLGLGAAHTRSAGTTAIGAAATPAVIAGHPSFDPTMAPSDREAVEAALAAARPEARALIERIGGSVTVATGATGISEAPGVTRLSPGRAEVTLELGAVSQAMGRRGVNRLVLHELGHAVDHLLVPEGLKAQLDAATPAGYGCDDGGRSGGCAAREERFAESFAKWATGDIGVDLYLGYRVPPPPPDWGTPLAPLASAPIR